MNDLEHPDISRALATGYPSRSRASCTCCDWCGDPVSYSDWYIEIDDETICWNCILDMRKDSADAE